MAGRKPKLELYWTNVTVDSTAPGGDITEPHVNWRLVAANGEVMCQCTQGFRDKTDAMRNLTAVAGVFFGDVDRVRIVGPGKKPQGAKT